jgi:hypothetical protein
MTILQAIDHLTYLASKYGNTTLVYFDCPECNKSFEPNTVSTLPVIHIKGNKNEKG